MNKYLIIWGCFLAIALYACSGEKEDDLIDLLAKEKRAIHDYLKQHAKGEITAIPYYSKRGLLIDSLFVFNHNRGGVVAKDSGWVVMNYDLSYLNGKVLDSSDPKKWDRSYVPGYAYGGPVLQRVDTGRFHFLAAAFRHIGTGESGGEVIIPSVLGAADGKSLHYKLISYRVFEDVAKNEKEMIERYVNSLRTVETIKNYPGEAVSDTVTYTLLMEKGTGTRKLQVGDSVLANMYYGILDDLSLVNGLRLVRRDTVKVLFNEAWQRNFPEGMVKGLQQLQEGDSAHIIVPYGMGFGATGRTQNATGGGKYYLEPPYSTLWCWVRIKKIIPRKEEE